MFFTVSSKKVLATLVGVFAFFGMTPDQAPLALALFMGLVSGTVMAWITGLRRKQVETLRWYIWVAETLALWGCFVLIILSAHEVATGMGFSIGPRLSGGLAVVMAFLRTDILNTIAKRFQREVETREV